MNTSKPRQTFDRRNPWVSYSKEHARQMREDHGYKSFRATRSDKNTKRRKKFF